MVSHLYSIHAGKHHIEKDHIKLCVAGNLKSGWAVKSRGDRMKFLFQPFAQEFCHGWFVFYNKNPHKSRYLDITFVILTDSAHLSTLYLHATLASFSESFKVRRG